MIVQIEDKAIGKILQTVVKEEVEFLARQLMRDKEVRFLLWCWLLQQMPQNGIKAAGIDDDALVARLTKYFKETGVGAPTSGPGGGADTTTHSSDPSGGGSTEPVMAGDCLRDAAAR